MAGIFATSGAKLFIGGALALKTQDWVLADFSGQSWIQINWMESMGAFGDEAAAVTFDAIEVARTRKLKGNRNAGDMAIVCGLDYGDGGQIALRAAADTNNNYGIKVEFNDAGTIGTKSARYFIALVMSARETLDAANNVMKLNATLAINSNIVRVNAT